MNIAVIGSGTMGSGIAQIAATKGHKTLLFDIDETALKKAKDHIEKMLNKLVAKNKISASKLSDIINNLQYTSKLEDIKESGFVIEAIVENLDIKKKLFAELESIVSNDTILATNTSSLSIASISSALRKPENLLGVHFFNPAPLMPLVEIVPSLLTSNSIAVRAKELIDGWGKTTVIVKDTPGFIVNRIARPFYGEALRIYEEGMADIPTIDWAMKEKGGFRMGPFELMDMIGNDINYSVNEKVFEQMYFDQRYKPSIIQKRYFEANLLGRKTGKGFYDYSENAVNPEPQKNDILGRYIFERILDMLINEAADALRLNVASKEDIELAMQKGVNYPKGLLAWADEIGIEKVTKQMQILFDQFGEDRYRPSPLLKKMVRLEEKFFD